MMRKIIITLLVAVVLISGAKAGAMERTKHKKEPSTQVVTSRGLLDCTGATVIDCNVTLYGEDNIGWPNNVENYSCHTGWTESGGERVYELTVEANTEINATLVPISGDSDIWLLGRCDEKDCLAFGDINLTYNSVDGGTYYIVVDGHLYDPDCVYNLTVTCEEVTPPPANNICDGAIDLQQPGGQFIIDLCEYTNQYDPGEGGCTGWPASGPEAVYRIGLEEGEWFHASIEPVDEFIDLSLYLITDCADPVGSCVAGADEETFGPEPESIIYQATATGTYYMLVDTWLTCDGGLTEVTYSTCGPFSGLVGYYPFNGSADDHSGYGHDGVVYGATLTTDRFGNPNSAYEFDGIDDHIEIIDFCPFMLTSWTIAAWFRADAADHGEQAIVAKHHNENGKGNFGTGLGGWGDIERRLGCGYETCDSEFDHQIFWDPVIDNEWYFFAYTRDHATGTIKVYVNDFGVVDSGTYLDEPCADAFPLLIGRRAGGYNFNGVIDDVRIFTHAITADEVLALYKEDNPVSAVNQVPQSTALLSCHPNPFNPQVTIKFNLDRAQAVELTIYDLIGKRLDVLEVDEIDAGVHTVSWNGRDIRGRAMPSGTYLVRLETETDVVSMKMMLLR